MKLKHNIVGIHITDRVKDAVNVQKVLTEYGSHIKTRLGLHDLDYKTPSGLLLVEMVGQDAEIQTFVAKLEAVAGVDVKTMIFEHAS